MLPDVDHTATLLEVVWSIETADAHVSNATPSCSVTSDGM